MNTLHRLSGNILSGVSPDKGIIFSADLSSSFIPDVGNVINFSRGSILPNKNNTGYFENTGIGEASFTNARRVENLASNTDSPTTQNVTVISGNSYQVTIGKNSAAGSTAVLSDAHAAGATLTGDGVIRKALTAPFTAATSNLAITISGDVKELMVVDVTTLNAGASPANDVIPPEYVSRGTLSYPFHGAGIDGVKYFSTYPNTQLSGGDLSEVEDAFIITDGTFETDTSEWTGNGLSTLSLDSNRFKILNVPAPLVGSAYHDFTTIIGRKYRIAFDFIKEAGSEEGSYSLIAAVGTPTYAADTAVTTTQRIAIDFIAATTSTRLTLATKAVADAYSLWDNVVCSKIDALPSSRGLLIEKGTSNAVDYSRIYDATGGNYTFTYTDIDYLHTERDSKSYGPIGLFNSTNAINDVHRMESSSFSINGTGTMWVALQIKPSNKAKYVILTENLSAAGGERWSSLDMTTLAVSTSDPAHTVHLYQDTTTELIYFGITITDGDGSTGLTAVGLSSLDNPVSTLGDNLGVFFSTWNINELAEITSPIYTSGASASRSPAYLQASVPDYLKGSSVNDLTILTEVQFDYDTDTTRNSTNTDVLFDISAGGGTDRIYMTIAPVGIPGKIVFYKKVSGSSYTAIADSAFTSGTKYRIAARIGQSGVHLFINGVKQATGNANTAAIDMSSNQSNLYIGSDTSGANQPSCTFHTFKIYSSDKSDAWCKQNTLT